MTKKEEYLAYVEKLSFEKGFISNDDWVFINEKWGTVRCSDALHFKAERKGLKRRSDVHEKHKYWEKHSNLDKAAEKLRRHLSCRDRLDSQEGKDLIYEYHKALDEREVANRICEAEFKKEV